MDVSLEPNGPQEPVEIIDDPLVEAIQLVPFRVPDAGIAAEGLQETSS